MTPIKTPVREDGSATLVCPACNTIKTISAEKFRNSRHGMAVRCTCGHVFHILFDFRSYYRKQTSITGTYEISGQAGGVGSGTMKIHNISRNGIGFTVSGPHKIEKGMELSLTFQLNDKNKTTMKKTVLVVSVQDKVIGCHFKDAGDLDKALGFFLQG